MLKVLQGKESGVLSSCVPNFHKSKQKKFRADENIQKGADSEPSTPSNMK
jgi:hypothetical protein